MKPGQSMVLYSRIGLSFVLSMSLQTPAFAASGVLNGTDGSNTGLLPIERSYINPDLVNVLFPIDSETKDGKDTAGGATDKTDSTTTTGRTNIGSGSGTTIKTTGSNNIKEARTMTRAMVDDEFRCNIFENTPYEEILSAVNALNTAVQTSPACGGSGKMDVKSIVDNNNSIKDSITQLRKYIDNPEAVQPDDAAMIVEKVDVAIRAANATATTFAQSEFLNKKCREQMDGGQVVTSLSNIMNGLTPYALMAAQMTGGTAAIPFLVGSSVITGALSSMGKIIEENSIKIGDASVRTAIIENTCQYIRLDQKYKFLVKSRTEQTKLISADITASRNLFSARIGGLPKEAQDVMNRKQFLDQTSIKMKSVLSGAQAQLDMNKQFLASTNDESTICHLGLEIAEMTKNKKSYVSQLLGSLDDAMIAVGTNNVGQAKALKGSADYTIKSLLGMNRRFNAKTNFSNCAKLTHSLIETVDNSANYSKQLLNLAQKDMAASVKSSGDGFLKTRLDNLAGKQLQANRLANSLDNLRDYANKITQSQIDIEMARLREGLLASRSMGFDSPVVKWFKFLRTQHIGEVKGFQNGLAKMRDRAYKLSPSWTVLMNSGKPGNMANPINPKDFTDSTNLVQFNLQNLPMGTTEHKNVCREMQDVWSRWVSAVDHLVAMDSFCGMIGPYIFDNRSEDQELVDMCRGQSQTSGRLGPQPSVIGRLKDDLIKRNTRDWALFIDHKISELACPGAPAPISKK